MEEEADGVRRAGGGAVDGAVGGQEVGQYEAWRRAGGGTVGGLEERQ